MLIPLVLAGTAGAGASVVGFHATTRLLGHERATRRLRRDVGPWLSMRDDLGLTDPLYVAQIAVVGPFPNPPGEAVYLLARTDDARRPLRAENGCTVRLPALLPAALWSVTAYDGAGRFFPDAAGRSSVTHRTVGLGQEVVVGPHGSGAGWLPTSGSGPLQLLLRLYEPAPDVWTRLEGGAAPAVTAGR